MTQSVYEKWAPLINQAGLTGSKANWLSEYAESQSTQLSNEFNSGSSEEFPSLLPIARQVFAKTIGLDLVTVNPIGGGNTSEELKKIDAEIKAENREGKIDAIIENKKYKEKKREDHPDFRKGSGPSSQLFYMDFKYDSSKKKKKKNGKK